MVCQAVKKLALQNLSYDFNAIKQWQRHRKCHLSAASLLLPVHVILSRNLGGELASSALGYHSSSINSVHCSFLTHSPSHQQKAYCISDTAFINVRQFFSHFLC